MYNLQSKQIYYDKKVDQYKEIGVTPPGLKA